MPHIPIPNTARVCLRYLQEDENTCNVFHVRAPADPTEADLIEIAEVFAAWWNTDYRPLVQQFTSLQAIEVTDMSADDEEGIVYTTGLPLAGGNAGGALPNNVTICSKFNTGLTGRSRRGRSYFAGLPQGALQPDQQRITSTFQTQLQAAWADLRSSLITAGFEWVVASLYTDGAPRVTGVTTPITSATVNTALDSQRRRLPERGS